MADSPERMQPDEHATLLAAVIMEIHGPNAEMVARSRAKKRGPDSEWAERWRMVADYIASKSD
jgi:hypothetical protein